MKWLYAFAALFVVVNADGYCKKDVTAACDLILDDIPSCNSNFSGFGSNIHHVQAYANEQLAQSYEYLLLATNFGTYVKNRPGFEKQFRELSDKAWGRSIDLMKHITKRGFAHNFQPRFKVGDTNQPKPRTIVEVEEINAMALALDAEKTLSTEAHSLHQHYSHSHQKTHYDAEMSHYLEEEFIEDQASTVRKLAGYVNDLKHFVKDATDPSLALFMFDEYLQKQ